MREIASRRELFIDRWLLDSTHNATLRLHHPQRQGVALALDAPWEGAGAHYATVFPYEGEYRLYYRGYSERYKQITAVALSDDGINWHRPNLGLFEWEGSKANNIVWDGAGEGSPNFAPFVDANPDAKPDERFKAVNAPHTPKTVKRTLRGATSADGFTWHKLAQDSIIADGYFDSQNLAFWDANKGCYVAYYRDFRMFEAEQPWQQRVRSVKYATSPDFLNWSEGAWLDYGDTPFEHFYTNATIAYPRAPHIYLSFPMRFFPQRKRLENYPNEGISDGVMLTSRDGFHWDRIFMEAFLRPGLQDENWADRNNGIGWGVLQTSPTELSLCWIEHFHFDSVRLARGTLRLDGFASLNAGYGGGEAVTHPFRFTGDELVLNYATSAAGSVRVELQEVDGTPIPGYTAEDSCELYGDAIEEVVRWQNGTAVSHLADRAIRLRLLLCDADIYALQFRPKQA